MPSNEQFPAQHSDFKKMTLVSFGRRTKTALFRWARYWNSFSGCNFTVVMLLLFSSVVLRCDKVVAWFYCEYLYAVSCVGAERWGYKSNK